MSSNGETTKKTRTIVIAERDNIAALVEAGKVVEFFIHRGDMLLGDVYLATVENILPSIDAAFVNLGADRMGFLHASDIPGKGELKDRIEPKQKILVQIMKEPTGHKGPRVSTSLSLPGRFLVLMPEEKGISISRKVLSPKERSRLKSIVNLLKPPGVGVIIRTEAENQSEEEIKEDMETMLEKWQNIVTTADSVSPPTLIHRDQDLLYRVIREACTDDVSEIFIDTPFGQHRVNQLIQTWNLGKNIKVSTYKGSDSLLVAKGIDKEIKSALQSKVNLPSGGYLYVQPTEALTVIDVNSGRFTSSQTQSETIRQTNLEAVDEIARQLRLRNVGGMIVIDFIDMDNRVDQLAILEAFENALQPDKAKPQVGQLSDLGLVELTRHRQGQSLSEIFTKKCPACGGLGAVLEDLNFAAPTLESDFRSKMTKTKVMPRLKTAVTTARQDMAQTQKTLKARSAVTQPPAPTPSKPAAQQVQQFTMETPVELETPQPAGIVEGYIKQETVESISNLSQDKLRKIFTDKKFYPEISKIIRFAGVPLKFAREHFGEEMNIIDVFTILNEMEAAFAKASHSPEPAAATKKITPIQMVTKPADPKKTENLVEEKPEEAFSGRYGISSNGENFEDLYEVIDEEEDLNNKVEIGTLEEVYEEEISEEVETSEETDEEEEEEEASETSDSDPAKKAARRGRKPAKGQSPRKKPQRGKPKSK